MNRKDFKIISNWISDNSFILDLGCGEGDFLAYLNKYKGSSGYGIEKDMEKAHVITDFIHKGFESGVINMMTDGTEQRDFLYDKNIW